MMNLNPATAASLPAARDLGRRLILAVATATIAGLLGGCSHVGYYGHLLGGQIELLRSREPIAELLADPATDPGLRRTLERVLDARAFASEVLKLPRNRSYTVYADLGRNYVVWNVFATPELSLDARQWCQPVVGCVAYRGYYDEGLARAFASRLAASGDDVHVGGVPAYSTLGWFDDPVLNTMRRWGDDALVGTVFHELAHQQLYVKNDTAFNESFASFVEDESLRQYRAARGLSAPPDEARREGYRKDFVRLVLETREELRALYASAATDAEKRRGKAAAFTRLRERQRALRDGPWQGFSGYDAWFERELNNARLLPFGLYDEGVPAFAQVFADSEGDWAGFYGAVERLAKLDPQDRRRQLEPLAARSAASARVPGRD